ncbi:hypothetical protein OSTOST_02971 [Ostertagia ostertagi]
MHLSTQVRNHDASLYAWNVELVVFLRLPILRLETCSAKESHHYCYRFPHISSIFFPVCEFTEIVLDPVVMVCVSTKDATDVSSIPKQTSDHRASLECVNIHLNILHWKTLIPNLHLALQPFPVYFAIAILRKRIISILGTNMIMSEQTRRLHSQLLKVGFYFHASVISEETILLVHLFLIFQYLYECSVVVEHL